MYCVIHYTLKIIILAKKAYISLIIIVLTALAGKAQLYTFDVKDSSTYSYNCGTTTGSYWGVKGDSCTLITSSTLINSACSATGMITVPIKVTINQTGQLSCSDSAHIAYTIDGGVSWVPLDTIIGCEQTANAYYWYYPDIPNNSSFQLRVIFDNSDPNDWWQIKDGDIVINDPCFLLPVGWVTVDGRETYNANVLNVTYEYAADQVDTVYIERSLDGNTFERIATTIQAVPGSQTRFEAKDFNPPLATAYYRVVVVHIDGESSTSDIVTISQSGIHTNPVLHISPNPATTQITINALPYGVQTATLTIYDLMGRVVWQHIGGYDNWPTTIDVGQLLAGQYIVQLTTGQATVAHQLMVQ